MLSQTKEKVQELVNKVNVLDYVLNTLNLSHKDQAETVEKLFKQASSHKLVLLEEILRLSNAKEVIDIKPA